MPVQNTNFFASYMAGRQARQREQAGAVENLLSQEQLSREKRFGELSRNPAATADEYARAGRTDIANYMVGQQNATRQQTILDENARRSELQRLGGIARSALGSGNPREYIRRAVSSGVFNKAFEAAGINPAEVDFNDPDLENELKLFADQFGEAEGPVLKTQPGPMGSQIVTYGDTMRVLEQPQPSTANERPVLTDVVLPDGSTQKQWLRPGESQGVPVGVPKAPDTRSGGGGGLPVGALRMVDDAKQAINSSTESLGLVDRAIGTIKSGKVNLGIFNNAVSRGRNLAGASSEASRAFTDINQTLEKLRNNYLLLAKGVQTEGDATRAWNSEIGENVQNDNKLAVQQLEKAKGLIERMVTMQNDRIDTIYANYGTQPPQRGAGAQSGGQPVRVSSPAEAARLPPGTQFVTPDGQVRVKR